MKDRLKELPIAVQDYLRQVVNASSKHSLMSVANLKGQGEILFVNELFCKVSGYTKDELIGQTHKLLNSGLHSSEFFKPIYTQTTDPDVAVSLLVRNKSKSGDFYWVQSSFIGLFDKKGKKVGILSLRTVVTELVESQAALEQAKTKLVAQNGTLASELARQRLKDKSDVQRLAILGLIGILGSILMLLGFVIIRGKEADSLISSSFLVVTTGVGGLVTLIAGRAGAEMRDEESRRRKKDD
jgi:PAS domain S-box-containing protein